MIFDCIDLVNRKYYNILDKQGTPFINHPVKVNDNGEEFVSFNIIKNKNK